jgi:hypothetical protein
MKLQVADFGNDSIVYNITETTRQELENKLNLFFAAENLPLRKDTPEEKVYSRGNKTMRLILGVFAKYFKVVVSIKQQDDLFAVRLLRDMNIVMSGGLVGIKASRKEFARMTEAFKLYMNN